MATSQFTFYTSADTGGPGAVSGIAGSAIPILRACLVNGYTGHPAAGWTEPLAAVSNRAAFKQGTGSCGFYCFINDNTLTGAAMEAGIVGWENMLTLDPPVGTGTGQFPLPVQANSTGYLIFEKTSVSSSTLRNWRMYADSRTFYWFVDVAGDTILGSNWFGDIFSLNGIGDAYRCFIWSRVQINNPNYSYFGYQSEWRTHGGGGLTGHYMARSLGGSGASLNVSKHPGTSALFGISNTSGGNLNGAMACPNPADGAIWLTPLNIYEPSNASIRGRLRGLWAAPHSYNNFSDGQILTGAGELAGKTFQCVRQLPASAQTPCVLFVETSNTVETNA